LDVNILIIKFEHNIFILNVIFYVYNELRKIARFKRVKFTNLRN